jgi:hypothetical protein
MSITTRAPYGFELEYMPLNAFGGTGPHRMTPIAAALGHKMPTLHGGGGGGVFKTIISIAAAVAIPFVAPMIATSIGLSATIGTALGSATMGGVLGGALVGAGLGAVKGAVLGEDIGRSALFGGIGGGVGGYGAATSPTTAGTGITPTATGGQGLAPTGGQGFSFSGSEGLSTGGLAQTTSPLSGTAGGFGTVDYGLTAGMQPSYGFTGAGTYGLQAPSSSYDIGAALSSGTPIDYGLSAGMQPYTGGLSVTSSDPYTGTQTTTAGGTTAYSSPTYTEPTATAIAPTSTSAMSAPTDYSVASGGTTATTTGATGDQSFMDRLGTAAQKSWDKMTDPERLADMTLRAAGMLAGSAIAGEGLSPEEQQMLMQQAEELRRLQQENQSLFNQRLEQAQKLLGESKYFDPEYFGLQRARRTQVAGGKAKRAGLRGLSGERRESEARRFDLATARDVGSSFDQGYLTGIQGRLQTQQAGLAAFPTSYPSSMTDYSALRTAYADADKRTRQQQEDIGSLFGSFTGGSSSTSLG